MYFPRNPHALKSTLLSGIRLPYLPLPCLATVFSPGDLLGPCPRVKCRSPSYSSHVPYSLSSQQTTLATCQLRTGHTYSINKSGRAGGRFFVRVVVWSGPGSECCCAFVDGSAVGSARPSAPSIGSSFPVYLNLILPHPLAARAPPSSYSPVSNSSLSLSSRLDLTPQPLAPLPDAVRLF